jgi:uncharacterized protein with GYD domain
MPTFVCRIKLTDQGVRNIKASPERQRQAVAMAEQMGAKVVSRHVIMGGEYDASMVIEAPDGDTVARFAMALSSQGNVRTTTSRVLTPEEFERIVAELP